MGTMELQQRGRRARVRTLWVAMAILLAVLLFDILLTVFLGATAIPVNIIMGVLVVLGLGTAARLVLGWYRERAARHNLQRMEIAPMIDGPYTISQSTQLQVHSLKDCSFQGFFKTSLCTLWVRPLRLIFK
jgi:xanthine/uracil permease